MAACVCMAHIDLYSVASSSAAAAATKPSMQYRIVPLPALYYSIVGPTPWPRRVCMWYRTRSIERRVWSLRYKQTYTYKAAWSDAGRTAVSHFVVYVGCCGRCGRFTAAE